MNSIRKIYGISIKHMWQHRDQKTNINEFIIPSSDLPQGYAWTHQRSEQVYYGHRDGHGRRICHFLQLISVTLLIILIHRIHDAISVKVQEEDTFKVHNIMKHTSILYCGWKFIKSISTKTLIVTEELVLVLDMDCKCIYTLAYSKCSSLIPNSFKTPCTLWGHNIRWIK